MVKHAFADDTPLQERHFGLGFGGPALKKENNFTFGPSVYIYVVQMLIATDY